MKYMISSQCNKIKCNTCTNYEEIELDTGEILPYCTWYRITDPESYKE